MDRDIHYYTKQHFDYYSKNGENVVRNSYGYEHSRDKDGNEKFIFDDGKEKKTTDDKTVFSKWLNEYKSTIPTYNTLVDKTFEDKTLDKDTTDEKEKRKEKREEKREEKIKEAYEKKQMELRDARKRFREIEDDFNEQRVKCNGLYAEFQDIKQLYDRITQHNDFEQISLLRPYYVTYRPTFFW